MWLSTLEIRTAQLGSITETTPKAPFLYLNRSPLRYGFRTGTKAIRYVVTWAEYRLEHLWTEVLRCVKVNPLLIDLGSLPFVHKFRWKLSVKWCWYFFGHRKQERDWVVPFTKYRYIFCFHSTWSLAPVIQTNGTENFARFAKNGKKVIPRKVLLLLF